MEIEHFFTCPHCWQKISMILDLTIADQSYIEDCEVCCRPIQIGYQSDEFELSEFWAEAVEQ